MSRKILIVDDQEVNRKLLRVQLGAEGFNSVEASDGQEALGLLKKQRVDAIISDILMPRMDGYRLCYEVRKDPRLRALPFIFYTATYTSPADEKLAAEAGGDKYLKKPASIRDIIQAIQDLTAGKEPRVGRRPVPVKELHIMKKYSEVLVNKLEEKNEELENARQELLLQNEKLQQAGMEVQRNLGRIRALHEIDVAISSTLDLHAVLDVLLEKIDLFLPCASAATVRLMNKETGEVEATACRNLDAQEWKGYVIKSLGGRTKEVVQTKAPLTVRNLATGPTAGNVEFYLKQGLISYLGVPLLAKGEVLGVLGVYTKEEHEFDKEEVEFLATLASQAAIAIHNAQLYEQSKKQNEDLKKRTEELEKANKVKDEFLSVMSHELRTPLNVVVGYAGMIRDGMLGEINPKQEEALGKMISRANDQLAIVNNILYATVLEAEKINVDIHEFVLGDFLNQLKPSYDLPTRKEPVIRWECADLLAPVRTDSAKLKLILQNLIDNALKFTKQGSVTVSAGIRQQWVAFKVADTGVGIPKEHLPFIFDKFRQADSSETRHFGGVGMGLYIVKKFSELLGGQVEVESEVGKGSTFTVRIPCGK